MPSVPVVTRCGAPRRRKPHPREVKKCIGVEKERRKAAHEEGRRYEELRQKRLRQAHRHEAVEHYARVGRELNLHGEALERYVEKNLKLDFS